MPFNSFNFWLVFPFIFSFYWLIPSKYAAMKKWYLILVSYLLYMNWKPAFAVVLLFVTGVTFYGAKALSVDDKQRRYGMIWITGLLSLLPLLIFKYYNVTYYGESQGISLGTDTVVLKPDEDHVSYTVNMAYTPGSGDQDFEGWLVSEGKNNIEGYTEGQMYRNNTDITISLRVVYSILKK